MDSKTSQMCFIIWEGSLIKANNNFAKLEFTKQINNGRKMRKHVIFRHCRVYFFHSLFLLVFFFFSNTRSRSVCVCLRIRLRAKCCKTTFWVNSSLPITFIQIKGERRFKKTHIRTHKDDVLFLVALYCQSLLISSTVHQSWGNYI